MIEQMHYKIKKNKSNPTLHYFPTMYNRYFQLKTFSQKSTVLKKEKKENYNKPANLKRKYPCFRANIHAWFYPTSVPGDLF